MRKIRVLVVDDSALARRMISGALEDDPDVEVVGLAANGSIGLARMDQLDPDLITLDVEMPGMGGLDTLTEIRRRRPSLPVILLSSLTRRGAEVTLDGLYRGASDYLTKPAGLGLDESRARLAEELRPLVRSLCRRLLAGPPPSPPPPPPRPIPSEDAGPIRAILIGASTGGPQALGQLLHELPADLPVPVLIVQHMPPLFTRILAESLSGRTPHRVREAVHGEPVAAGSFRLAPGDRHLEVVGPAAEARLGLTLGPLEHSCRPSVNVLFRSAARVYEAGVLAVVLTGMGQDGLEGARSVREARGRILVQDEASSVVWGMPRAVHEAGLATAVLPPADLGAEIARQLRDRPLGAFGRLPP